ncbi:hypothetical protein CSA56_16105 [candidate division KSB3 bacterium]|uniref:ComEC/Rec2-related protein domain-containing protein n=1 Tax=candidate division KSB3 bacterium TaxID=2044937 RepID=A0A2G6KAW8_9BACT|nr:MAG: hypothetical protein CSA56_16105 [candidate division KSB3 bacterium]
MIRPLHPLLSAFIGGILLASWGNAQASSTFILISIPILVLVYGVGLGSAYLCYRAHYALLTTCLLVFLGFASGMIRYAVSNHVPLHHISYLVDNEVVTIEGWLYRSPEFVGTRRYLYVKTTSVEKRNTRYHTTGKIRITLTKAQSSPKSIKQLVYGSSIRARLHLSLPKNLGNFNYREYLRRQGIYLIGKLYHERNILKRSPQQGHLVLSVLYALRARILTYLDSFVHRHGPEYEAVEQPIQIIKAMTMGSRQGLSQETRDLFRNAGMYHFLVISGVHIAILAWAFHKGLMILRIPVQYRSILLSGLLFAYAGLTGFHFPVLRAVLMASVFYLSMTCNRIADPLYSLSGTVAILLFIFPNSLFEVSFQLTAAATLYLLLFFRFLNRQRWFGRVRSVPWFLKTMAMSLMATTGAMIGVSPLLLYYFGRLYPASFFSNLVALPVISLLLPSSLLVNFLSLFMPGLTVLDLLLSVNVFLTRVLTGICSFFSNDGIALPTPSRFVMIVYYLALYALLAFLPIKKFLKPQRHKEYTGDA